MTILQAYDLFMYEQRFRNNSSATLEYYSNALGMFLEFAGSSLPVEQLDISLYREYVIHLQDTGIKSTSVNSYVRAVKAFYNFLIEDERIRDCSRKLKLVKQRKQEIIPLSDVEIKRLLDCFDTSDLLDLRNKCLTLLMLDCGLRRSEPCRLTVSDVDFHQNALLVLGKGDKQRLVPMGRATSDALFDYNTRVADRRSGKPNDPFFLDRFGAALDPNAVKIVFQDLKVRADIPRLHCHLLRHTFATLYLVDGGNLELLRCIMGHSSIAITQIYLHLASNYKLLLDSHISHVDGLSSD